MNSIPKNLELLHSGEEFLRTKSLEAITADEDLSRHVAVIEKSMDLLNLLSTNPPSDEDENTKTVRLLGMRLFNGCAAAFQLVVSGYYQNAAMIMRDLLETVFLLGFFLHDPSKISEWRLADDSIRKKVFAPYKIRNALDEKSGFTKKSVPKRTNYFVNLRPTQLTRAFKCWPPRGRGIIVARFSTQPR